MSGPQRKQEKLEKALEVPAVKEAYETVLDIQAKIRQALVEIRKVQDSNDPKIIEARASLVASVVTNHLQAPKAIKKFQDTLRDNGFNAFDVRELVDTAFRGSSPNR